MTYDIELLSGKQQLDVLEGVVTQIEQASLWVKQADGQEVSLAVESPSESFRVGHKIRAVTTGLRSNPKVIKAINRDTNHVTTVLEAEQQVPGIISGGCSFMQGISPYSILVMIVPGFNWLFGLFLGLAALGIAKRLPVGGWRSFGIGVTAFGATLVLGVILMGLKSTETIGMWMTIYAPTPGVVIGYGLLWQRMVVSMNEFGKRVDGLL